MPELPEVETTLRGIEPLLCSHTVAGVILRTEKLRWPLDRNLETRLTGARLKSVRRRAKYLLFDFGRGTLLLHLGMSGSLRVVDPQIPAGKHDHVDLIFRDAGTLRLTDPRKFGGLLWVDGAPELHALLHNLGPEPLAKEFDAEHLYRCSSRRRIAVKSFIMDQKVVVGVGNIYASEALFRALIRPDIPAGGLSLERCRRLVREIKTVLSEAIAAGGTTLQDFQQVDGRPGYFKQNLLVYGREGQPCPSCGKQIRNLRIGQRSTFFCRSCQH